MSTIKPNAIPENVLRCMNRGSRPSGNAGLTTAEANAKHAARAEKAAHKEISNWLRLNNIVFVHSRMDCKPTIAEGLPDFMFAYIPYRSFPMPIAVEVKTQSEMSVKQLRTRALMLENGWKYFIVDGLVELKGALGTL